LLDALRAEFYQHREATDQNLADLNTMMPTKADRLELLDLEKRFKDIIDDIVKQMLELMPSKDDI
jgi:hypothetical protein